MAQGDVERLREAGLDNRAVVDANQVVAYFNYVNRVADGLGVELETEWPGELRAESGYAASVPAAAVPWLDAEEMRELDRIAVEDLGLTLERMTENAGRSLAELAGRLLGGRAAGRAITVLAGPGGNGAGGVVAARHLANAGAELVVDALLGYSQSGAPREEVARLISWANAQRVVALDLPSGLLSGAYVTAEATLTLAAPKRAHLDTPGGAGALYLADLGIPAAAYERLGIEWRSPFASAPIVRIL